MKIAILMRGPLRPTAEAGLTRARSLAEEVINNGHEPDVYFAAWSQDGNEAQIKVLASEIGRNTLFLAPPAEEEIVAHCEGLVVLPCGRLSRNTFLQYYLSRQALRLIRDTGKYDYVIHSRPDMDVRLGQYFSDWLIPGRYCTLHHPSSGHQFINDQFSIAQPDVMFSAWDHGSAADLGQLIRRATIPEDVLRIMVADAQLDVTVPNHELWGLDPDRNPGS